MDRSIVYTNTIYDWTWQFYRFEVNSTVGELVLDVNRIGNTGAPEFYLRYDLLPTIDLYTRMQYYYNGNSLVVRNPLIGNWILGVYARKIDNHTSTSYSVSANGNKSIYYFLLIFFIIFF